MESMRAMNKGEGNFQQICPNWIFQQECFADPDSNARVSPSHGEWTSPNHCCLTVESAAKDSDQLQLVPDVNPALTDSSGRQFQNAVRFPLQAGDPEGSQFRPKLHHPQVFRERDRVDRKQHAKCVNAARRPDEQPASGVELSPPQQAHQASERGVRDRNLCADRGATRSVSQLDLRPHRSRSHKLEPSRAS
jgi:hypothetical protein